MWQPTFAPIAREEAPAPQESGFDGLPVPLVKTAADGRILRANHEARRLLAIEGQALGNISERMEGLGRAVTDWLALTRWM